MKNITWVFIFLLFASHTHSKEINVVTTYPYIASIVEIIGKDKVEVLSLAGGRWNPHSIVPRPSFIGKLRKADLLIINGAQLEIGWLPQLIKQANNPNIQFESSGFLDLSHSAELIEIPTNVSRAKGDVHPDGNPHFYLDYQNVKRIALSIKNKMSELSPENKASFEKNYIEFIKVWNDKIIFWQEKLKKVNQIKIIEYHKIFDYFLKRAEIVIASTIEPLPGIPPTSRHIEETEKLILRENIQFILQDVYNPADASQYLSKKYNIKMLTLPHDVDSVDEAKEIFSLYDEIVRRLAND